MNTKRSYFMLFIALILVVLSACSPAVTTEIESPTPDPVFITSIAQTAQAGVFTSLTQNALDVPSETPTSFPTLTPENTITPLPSSTSSTAMISVEIETLCRLGPGLVYDRVGELSVGKMVEVFGLDPSRDYYLIRNPAHPDSYCWVWGFYATPVNSFAGIPVYTPMYTPVPRYTTTPTNSPSTGACVLVSLAPANNTKYIPSGEDFDAIWTIKNTGSFPWLKPETDLKFIGKVNESFHTGSDLLDLEADVAVGDNIVITINMEPPATQGTFTETWALIQGEKRLCTMSLTIIIP